jgi:hypothetical protein
MSVVWDDLLPVDEERRLRDFHAAPQLQQWRATPKQIQMRDPDSVGLLLIAFGLQPLMLIQNFFHHSMVSMVF